MYFNFHWNFQVTIQLYVLHHVYDNVFYRKYILNELCNPSVNTKGCKIFTDDVQSQLLINSFKKDDSWCQISIIKDEKLIKTADDICYEPKKCTTILIKVKKLNTVKSLFLLNASDLRRRKC